MEYTNECIAEITQYLIMLFILLYYKTSVL